MTVLPSTSCGPAGSPHRIRHAPVVKHEAIVPIDPARVIRIPKMTPVTALAVTYDGQHPCRHRLPVPGLACRHANAFFPVHQLWPEGQ